MNRDFHRAGPLGVGALGLALILSPPVIAQSHPVGRVDADALVRQLRDVPTSLYLGPLSWLCASSPCPRPPLPPGEARRRKIYDQLYALGSAGVLALGRGLRSPDVSLRHNVAAALEVLGGGWWFWDRNPHRIDISAALPALLTALRDPDPSVRGLAAQDIGNIGPRAAVAVPALVKLLTSEDEQIRNSACIGLMRIGPAAKGALPALTRARSDPSADVQQFAESAIESIEGAVYPAPH
jgi:hypothetical protein